MALPPNAVTKAVDAQINELEQDGAPPMDAAPAPKPVELYRLDPKTSIPVSRYEGPMWEGRKQAGSKQISSLVQGWEEAEHYYGNVQQNHRQETEGDKSGTRNYAKNRRDGFSMTENIVYATVNAVIPSIYAKNPNVEVTMVDENLEQFGVMLEHLLNRLADMKYSPGVHLKPKVKKSIVRCEITNEAWVMVGWTKRDDSADQARDDITRIGAELAKAKDEKEITRLEGELMALEESIDLLNPPGPWVMTVRAEQVLCDTGATEDDFNDANWKMVSVMMPTNYLNARYRIKKGDEYVNIYKPTHVVDASDPSVDSTQQELDNFKLFGDAGKDDPKDYGYTDRRAYERSKRTKVWYCFDRVKRRFYLYADNDWTWPIWCYDDPYMLPNFYPLVRMQYHSDPKAPRSRGEVSHYLDQQDEINTIADELNRARTSLRDNTLFDSNALSGKDVEDIMLNGNKKFKGIKVPEGRKIEDLISGPPMPTLQYEHLWDSSKAKSAVNMISGVMEAMRGEQFKTNTTNDAIANYNSISSVRLDEKRDAVEDFIGDIMFNVMFLWLRFATVEMTQELVGPQFAQEVALIEDLRDPKKIRQLVQCNIEGGSTQKPTSAAKKAEALQVGQILGQFASASPYVVIILLKVFKRAFDGVAITDTDWKMLIDSITMQLQQGAPAQGAEGEGQPNEEDAAVADMVQRGMPEEEARRRVAESKKKTQPTAK